MAMRIAKARALKAASALLVSVTCGLGTVHVVVVCAFDQVNVKSHAGLKSKRLQQVRYHLR